MILTLDVGNSQIFGGVFEKGELTLRFRKSSKPHLSSDELGLFLRSVLRENGGDPTRVRQIVLSSVVPEMIYSLRSCCRKYFSIDPFVLQAGAKTAIWSGTHLSLGDAHFIFMDPQTLKMLANLDPAKTRGPR